MMKVQGACHCGLISYEAEVDPERVGLCNCTDCQVLSGTAYRVSVTVPAAGFRLLSGKPRGYVKTADSGVLPRDVDVARLQSLLRAQGVPLREASVTVAA